MPVSKGIKDADQLIEDALAGKGSITAENKTVDAAGEKAEMGLQQALVTVFIKIS